jgi:hypothetical protein
MVMPGHTKSVKVYEPLTGGEGTFAVIALVTALLGFLKYGDWLVSIPGLIGTVAGFLIPAYLIFGSRLWVFLYEHHLELHPRFAKYLKDHFGVSVYSPKVVYYRQIVALRRSRGFGGHNALAVLIGSRKPWQRNAYGIPYQGVKNYADLEAELCRRAPSTCEFYSVNFLGHRGPF